MGFQVRFLKGSNELSLPEAPQVGGWHENGHYSGYPYVRRSPEGHAQLRIGTHQYCWSRDSVGCDFSSPETRAAYMKKINDACGEIVAVPAETAA